jgi:hypothetical protein
MTGPDLGGWLTTSRRAASGSAATCLPYEGLQPPARGGEQHQKYSEKYSSVSSEKTRSLPVLVEPLCHLSYVFLVLNYYINTFHGRVTQYHPPSSKSSGLVKTAPGLASYPSLRRERTDVLNEESGQAVKSGCAPANWHRPVLRTTPCFPHESGISHTSATRVVRGVRAQTSVELFCRQFVSAVYAGVQFLRPSETTTQWSLWYNTRIDIQMTLRRERAVVREHAWYKRDESEVEMREARCAGSS